MYLRQISQVALLRRKLSESLKLTLGKKNDGGGGRLLDSSASINKMIERRSHVELIQHIGKALNSHPFRIIEPGERAHAAVALILEETPHGLNVLFIERSINPKDVWSGQIALPGGRIENHDNSPRHTAERETREELGVNLSDARYLGRLSDVVPGGLRIVVSCFVYAVNHHPILHPDRHEVADAFWLPLREINNPARRSQVEFMFRERRRKFPAVKILYGREKPLWGLTYRVLRNLNRVIDSTVDPNHCLYRETNNDHHKKVT